MATTCYFAAAAALGAAVGAGVATGVGDTNRVVVGAPQLPAGVTVSGRFGSIWFDELV